MSQFDKLIQKVFDEKDITYQEAEKILISLGYVARTPRSGSSHITFTKSPNQIITLVNGVIVQASQLFSLFILLEQLANQRVLKQLLATCLHN